MAVLVLSQYVEERYASDLLAAGGGGMGYLLKERVADVAQFVESVRRVAGGGTAFDPEVVAQLLGRRRRDDPLEELTPREREVLSLMAEGLSNNAIAKKLWLTVGAVEKHISSIFSRLGLLPGDDENRRVRAVLTYLEASR
jgi:DNA-binding NarL/FixJ family response regulator